MFVPLSFGKQLFQSILILLCPPFDVIAWIFHVKCLNIGGILFANARTRRFLLDHMFDLHYKNQNQAIGLLHKVVWFL